MFRTFMTSIGMAPAIDLRLLHVTKGPLYGEQYRVMADRSWPKPATRLRLTRPGLEQPDRLPKGCRVYRV